MRGEQQQRRQFLLVEGGHRHQGLHAQPRLPRVEHSLHGLPHRVLLGASLVGESGALEDDLDEFEQEGEGLRGDEFVEQDGLRGGAGTSQSCR